jgi:hypothetical protein
MCWYTPAIPALGKLRQEDLEFKASLGCMVKCCLQQNNNKTETIP